MRGPYLLYRAAECGKLQFMALALAEGVDINTTEKARALAARKLLGQSFPPRPCEALRHSGAPLALAD